MYIITDKDKIPKCFAETLEGLQIVIRGICGICGICEPEAQFYIYKVSKNINIFKNNYTFTTEEFTLNEILKKINDYTEFKKLKQKEFQDEKNKWILLDDCSCDGNCRYEDMHIFYKNKITNELLRKKEYNSMIYNLESDIRNELDKLNN